MPIISVSNDIFFFKQRKFKSLCAVVPKRIVLGRVPPAAAWKKRCRASTDKKNHSSFILVWAKRWKTKHWILLSQSATQGTVLEQNFGYNNPLLTTSMFGTNILLNMQEKELSQKREDQEHQAVVVQTATRLIRPGYSEGGGARSFLHASGCNHYPEEAHDDR